VSVKEATNGTLPDDPCLSCSCEVSVRFVYRASVVRRRNAVRRGQANLAVAYQLVKVVHLHAPARRSTLDPEASGRAEKVVQIDRFTR
jgi:hypothetical protein